MGVNCSALIRNRPTFCTSTVLVALAMASGCPCSSTIKDLTAFSTSFSDCRVAMTTDLSLSFVITVIKVGMAVLSIRCTKDESETWQLSHYSFVLFFVFIKLM